MKLLRRLRDKLVHEYRSMPPKRFCIDVALGWTIGLWPMIGIRTLLGLLIFLVFSRNKTLLVATNQISFLPFLLLYFAHLRLGEYLLGAPRLEFGFIEMWHFVEAHPINSVIALLPSVGHAIVGWAVLTPFYFASAYLVSRWWKQTV